MEQNTRHSHPSREIAPFRRQGRITKNQMIPTTPSPTVHSIVLIEASIHPGTGVGPVGVGVASPERILLAMAQASTARNPPPSPAQPRTARERLAVATVAVGTEVTSVAIRAFLAWWANRIRGCMSGARLTARQHEVLSFIEREIAAKGYPPTTRELAAACGLGTPSAAHRMLGALERKGYLTRTPGAKRAIVINPPRFDGGRLSTGEAELLATAIGWQDVAVERSLEAAQGAT